MAPGVFTTLRVREGRPWLWAAHVERLREGAAHFGLPPPPADLRARVLDRVRGLPDARVRVTLAGGGVRVEARAYEPPAAPWVLCPIRAPWSPGEDTMRRKTTAREAYDRARTEAGTADDALLVDPSGSILETTVANVFFVLPDGSLRTPPATLPILPGVARAAVLAAAADTGVAAREAPCGPREAAGARDCFVSNALFLVHPVGAIEGIARYRRSDVARSLQETVARRALPPRIIP